MGFVIDASDFQIHTAKLRASAAIALSRQNIRSSEPGTECVTVARASIAENRAGVGDASSWHASFGLQPHAGREGEL